MKAEKAHEEKEGLGLKGFMAMMAMKAVKAGIKKVFAFNAFCLRSLQLKLIAFDMREAKERELPTLAELAKKLQGGEAVLVNELRMVGMPMARVFIDRALKAGKRGEILRFYQEAQKREVEEMIHASALLPEKKRNLLRVVEILVASGITSAEDIEIIIDIVRLGMDAQAVRGGEEIGPTTFPTESSSERRLAFRLKHSPLMLFLRHDYEVEAGSTDWLFIGELYLCKCA